MHESGVTGPTGGGGGALTCTDARRAPGPHLVSPSEGLYGVARMYNYPRRGWSR